MTGVSVRGMGEAFDRRYESLVHTLRPARETYALFVSRPPTKVSTKVSTAHTTKPASRNFLQQQARFDRFLECYNHERPHQALDMHHPAELYSASAREYRGLTELEYPFHDRTITVTRCGRICIGSRKINLSQVFAGQNVGIKEIADKVWLVSFMHYDLGFFDHETGRVECAQNPFEPKVLPMSPE
jgi:putative transposase